MMIFSLVAMIGLEKCCITSACLQWLCHSGERIVARGPLVFILASNFSNHVPYFLCWSSRVKFEDVLLPRCSFSCFYCLASFRSHLFGCLLNFRKAGFPLFIEFLTSLLNQGLFLFERVKDFGIHFSAIWINVSIKACISSAVLNISGFNFSLHNSIKFSLFALFRFHLE